jgi:hypothetical protein
MNSISPAYTVCTLSILSGIRLCSDVNRVEKGEMEGTSLQFC